MHIHKLKQFAIRWLEGIALVPLLVVSTAGTMFLFTVGYFGWFAALVLAAYGVWFWAVLVLLAWILVLGFLVGFDLI